MKKFLLILLFTIPLFGFGIDGDMFFEEKDVSHIESVYEKEINYIENLIDSLMYSPIHNNNPYGPTTVGMNNSVSRGIEEYDKLLNKYYKLLKEELPDEKFIILRDSQRNWLKYREDYLFYHLINLPNGTVYTNVFKAYEIGIIRERVDLLFSLYKNIKRGYSEYKIVPSPSLNLWIGHY
jgi:uncharacterized protein YecT (DUF1311 family)